MVTKEERIGKIQTVQGLISPEEAGITLPHEHLMVDSTCYYKKPLAGDIGLSREPLSLENLQWVRHHGHNSMDNLSTADEATAIQEALRFRAEGGQTIVDCSNRDILRDPRAIARVSRMTGLHVVMGSGYYYAGAYICDMGKKTEDNIASEVIQDITTGAEGTNICSGIIGELGCSWPLDKNEEKVLKAGAKAQQATGAIINIHPGRHKESPLQIIEILRKAGADINRVVIDDIDRTLLTHKDRCALAKTGCYLGYNHFGQEGYYQPDLSIDLPNDHAKINEIILLIKEGYLEKILISQDICQKVMQYRYGGWGYAHILEYAVPVMRLKGMTEQQINTIMVDNPKRMLTLV
jgi:phosphotriesterase-related protein